MALLDRRSDVEAQRERVRLLMRIVVVVLLILIGRLGYLQLVKGKIFEEYSQKNSLKPFRLEALRGLIFDRHGTLIVENEPSFDLVYDFSIAEDAQAEYYLRLFADLTRENPAEAVTQFKKASMTPYGFRYLRYDIPKRTVSLLKSRQWEIPPLQIMTRIKRTYPWGAVGAHLLGHLGEVTKGEIRARNREAEHPYYEGDVIGKLGVERQREADLRGVDGIDFIQVNARGRRVLSNKEVLGLQVPQRRESVAGRNVVLTVDQSLQNKAHQLLQGKVGALVAMDPHTGEILTMVSSPSFLPALFSRGISSDSWKDLMTDPNHPLMNRPIQSQNPPGSIFKMIVAFALLSERAIHPEATVHCGGAWKYGNRYFHCWKKEGHGEVDLYKAISQSCDLFFYQMADRLGVDKIAYYASQFGFGAPTGVDLAHETAGILPSPAWKRARFDLPWYPGETISYGIGQGYLLATPIQIAVALSAIVNGGYLLKPFVVRDIVDHEGSVFQHVVPDVRYRIEAPQEIWQTIQKGLIGVVNDPSGTAYRYARAKEITIGGKTGTSQVIQFGREDVYTKCENLPYEKRHHAWFAGFAPIEDPKIVVVSFIEHGCAGSSAAAPLARELIRYYWQLSTTQHITKQEEKGPLMAVKNKPPEAEKEAADIPAEESE
ncbi:MAG: penicillin-binding protein 2 [Deltaproteobacteria bacterium]|nr:penicillin-binding protein 2 [Deltaproteobacteria bacterium]